MQTKQADLIVECVHWGFVLFDAEFDRFGSLNNEHVYWYGQATSCAE